MIKELVMFSLRKGNVKLGYCYKSRLTGKVYKFSIVNYTFQPIDRKVKMFALKDLGSKVEMKGSFEGILDLLNDSEFGFSLVTTN